MSVITGGKSPEPIDVKVEGIKLDYLAFDKENRKTLQIKCQESHKEGDDRLFLKDLEATFFKKGSMNQDVKVTGKTGYAQNELKDFIITSQAKIFSGDFTVESSYFELRNLEYVYNRLPTEFQTKNVLKGTAANGVEGFLNENGFKMYDVKGTYLRENKLYRFEASRAWIFKDDSSLFLSSPDYIESDNAFLRGEWIYLKFAKDFQYILTSTAKQNGNFQFERKITDNRKEKGNTGANYLACVYDQTGNVRELRIRDQGWVVLENGLNKTTVLSSDMVLFFDEKTNGLSLAKVNTSGLVSMKGKNNIDLSGNRMELQYDTDGEPRNFKAEENCQFTTDHFHGFADRLFYYIPTAKVTIEGQMAQIRNKNNVFVSTSFSADLAKNQLSTQRGIKATVVPNKKNALFSQNPIFITSQGLDLQDQGNQTTFRKNVHLFQDEMDLTADRLGFDLPQNSTAASGNVSAKFKNGDTLFIIKGDSLVLNSQKNTLIVEGNATLKSNNDVLKAKQLILEFDSNNELDNIRGREAISFVRDDIRGEANWLKWLYKKKEITFQESAQISTRNEGITKGKKLILNLNDNRITVSGEEGRTETIISK